MSQRCDINFKFIEYDIKFDTSEPIIKYRTTYTLNYKMRYEIQYEGTNYQVPNNIHTLNYKMRYEFQYEWTNYQVPNHIHSKL